MYLCATVHGPERGRFYATTKFPLSALCAGNTTTRCDRGYSYVQKLSTYGGRWYPKRTSSRRWQPHQWNTCYCTIVGSCSIQCTFSQTAEPAQCRLRGTTHINRTTASQATYSQTGRAPITSSRSSRELRQGWFYWTHKGTGSIYSKACAHTLPTASPCGGIPCSKHSAPAGT